MTKKQLSANLQVDHLTRAITIVRGHNVLLDTQLSALYGVETRALIQAVKRNIGPALVAVTHCAFDPEFPGFLLLDGVELHATPIRPLLECF